jgi:hypothetical protein
MTLIIAVTLLLAALRPSNRHLCTVAERIPAHVHEDEAVEYLGLTLLISFEADEGDSNVIGLRPCGGTR